MKSEKALSEIVGALILVALVIAGIGIIGVVMFSTPPPQSKEKVVLSSSSIDCTGDSFAIVVRHEGGDIIDPQKMKYFLTTEYLNGTPMNRFNVSASSFFHAEKFSEMDRTQICNLSLLKLYPYLNNTSSMRNGDAIVIWYQMDQSSTN